MRGLAPGMLLRAAGSVAEAASFMPAQGLHGVCSPLVAYSVTCERLHCGPFAASATPSWLIASPNQILDNQPPSPQCSLMGYLMACCHTHDQHFLVLGTLQALELSGQQEDRILQPLAGDHDDVSPDMRQLQQEGSFDRAEGYEQEVSIVGVTPGLGGLQQGPGQGGAKEHQHIQERVGDRSGTLKS